MSYRVRNGGGGGGTSRSSGHRHSGGDWQPNLHGAGGGGGGRGGGGNWQPPLPNHQSAPSGSGGWSWPSVQEVQAFLQKGIDKTIKAKKDIDTDALLKECLENWEVQTFDEFEFGPYESFWPVSGHIKRRNKIKEVEQTAQAIIDSRLSAGAYVSFSVVLSGVLGALEVSDFAELKIGKPFYIPVLKNLANRESHFLTVLMCYISTRTFGSLYDFEQFVLQHEFRDVKGALTCFEDLQLGPLLSIPEVRRSFAVPEGMLAPPKLTVGQMMTTFVDKFTNSDAPAGRRHSRDKKRVDISTIIEALEFRFQIPREELCVTLSDRNFGQYVMTVIEILKMENAEMKQMRTDFVKKACEESQTEFDAWQKQLKRSIRKSQHIQLVTQLESRFSQVIQANPNNVSSHVSMIRMALQQATGGDEPTMNLIVFTALIHVFCLRCVEKGVAKRQGQDLVDAHIARLQGGGAADVPAPPGLGGYPGGLPSQQQSSIQVSAYDLTQQIIFAEQQNWGEWKDADNCYEWADYVPSSALEAAKMLEDSVISGLGATNFASLGHGSFLDFLGQSEECQLVKDHVDRSCSSGAGYVFNFTKIQCLVFVFQNVLLNT